MTHEETKATSNVVEKQKTKKRMSANLWVLVVAANLAIGYVAGVYHFQIEAAIGPIFSYNAHSGNIDLSSVQRTYNELAARYDGKLDVSKLIEGANRGLVDAVGDTYTVYMSPQEADEYNNGLSGNIGGGIGAEIGLRNNNVSIIRALPNNPAEKAGLAANDVILSINDESTAGWTVDKAVGQIRGEPGTTVKLRIQRGETIKDYSITRAVINNPSVESSVKNGIGILTISRFDSETGDLARAAAQSFVKQGVKSVILDLRGNPGGFVSAASDVAGIWIDGKAVVTERNGTKVKATIKAGNDTILAGMPTVVLVNGASASASEIVAGALKDYKIAKLVGENTFGKGSVQELVPLELGAQLKVTIARWYTPNGKNIMKNGIAPDVIVTLTQQDIDKGLDPQMDKAIKLLRA